MKLRITVGLNPALMALLERPVRAMELMIEKLVAQGEEMKEKIAALTEQVHANTSVIDGAIQVIGTLAAQIEALKDDPVALQALADELKAKDAALAEAIASVPAPTPVA